VEVYVSIIILLAVVGYSFAPGVARNTARTIDQAPAFLDRLSNGDIAMDLRGKYGWTEEQEFRLRFFLVKHKEEIQRLVPTVDRYLSSLAIILWWLLLSLSWHLFLARWRTYRGSTHPPVLSQGAASQDTCRSKRTSLNAQPIHQEAGSPLWFFVCILFGRLGMVG